MAIFHPPTEHCGLFKFGNSFPRILRPQVHINNRLHYFARGTSGKNVFKLTRFGEVAPRILWQMSDTLVETLVQYVESKNVRWSPTHVREFQFVLQMLASGYLLITQ
jgi:hypothetical protein